MENRTRKVALVGSVVVLALLAGCAGVISGDSDPVEHAPEGSDALVHVDMSMMAADENQQLLEAAIDADDDLEDQEELLEEFEDETGLDLRDARQFLAFADVEGGLWDSSGGVVVYSEWETETVIESIEDDQGTDYEQTSYDGEDVLYEPVEEPTFGSATYVGVLGDGQFVVGDEESVTDSLEVEYGDADPVSGDVREAYDDARDGHVTLAVAPPADQVPAHDPTVPDEIDLEPFQQVTAVSAVYYTDGGDAGLEAELRTESDDVALDIADVLDGAVSIASGSVDDDELTDELRAIEIEQDGATVSIDYRTDVDDIAELIEDEEL